MNIQQLRQSLKMKWLSYYEQNRPWLVKMRIWGTYEGLRRPSSGFILATLSVLEPEFDQILTFILDLNNNPDKIVAALGLNFNPDKELDLITAEDLIAVNHFSNESLEETDYRDQPAPLVAAHTEMTSDASINRSSSKQPPTALTYTVKPVTSLTVTNGVNRDRQPVSSVAIATQVKHESSEKILIAKKLSSGLLRLHQPERSLTKATEVSSMGKTLPSLAITNKVPANGTNLQSLAVAIKVPNNAKTAKIQLQDMSYQVKLSPSTNARSLASWVDEFCQGADYDPKEAIFTPF
ncbi:MAG: DUF5331 domain-containing protein [Mojavia pulchra JT2-VF2]|jgi:hypothetical protein|uniref:DUF5331 domain-containing protein n=1 Tax=Mojavia pulchra JT2-VF2 TaxID=287848 RepID=A0A951UGN0_9NOST|nr:DUF5331 domain-containing protein [Mojavia pulchra JT2-VF2]